MKILRFEGHSDDTFGEYASTNDDYDNCASGKPIEWLVSSQSENAAIVVTGQYCPGNSGGWLVGVSTRDPVCDDVPLPKWPMRIEQGERPYSPALVIEAPDDVTIRCLQIKEHEDEQ